VFGAVLEGMKIRQVCKFAFKQGLLKQKAILKGKLSELLFSRFFL
jgi:hypothetical protein